MYNQSLFEQQWVVQLLSVKRNRDQIEIEKSSYSLGTDFSVAKISMLLPFFFSVLNDFNIFFQVIAAAKRVKKIFMDNNVGRKIYYSNDCEFMKIIDVNWWLRNKCESDFRSNENYSSSSENEVWKKSGLYGIWKHGFCNTGAVLYQPLS